jgi:HTH-type transcriptional regulator/antitoxin HipB
MPVAPLPHAADEHEPTIADALRTRRRALGLTQEQLAELSGVSPRFIGALERGKPSVRLDHVSAVASTLGLALRVD